MPYYNECPDCGAHLDPGEICGCTGAEKEPPPDHAHQRAAGGPLAKKPRYHYIMFDGGMQAPRIIFSGGPGEVRGR